MARTHDVVFVKDNDKYGFMLAQNKLVKQWQAKDTEFLPPSYITGEATYANVSPEQEVIIQQTDWRKGIQDLNYDDERKYHSAVNCDARYKGMVILSPKQDALSLPGSESTSSKTVTNADFEAWTGDDPDDWTVDETGGGAITKESTEIHGDSYSCKFNSGDWPSGGGGSVRIYQDLTLDSVDKGRVARVKAWCKTTFLSGDVRWRRWRHPFRIGIDDGISTEWLEVRDTSWIQKELRHRIDAKATRLRIIFEQPSSYLSIAYLDDVEADLADVDYSQAVKFLEFQDKLIFGYGTELCKIDEGAITAYTTGMSKEITDLCIFDSKLFLAQGFADEYFYTSDLSTFTEGTLALGAGGGERSYTRVAYAADATSIVVKDGTAYSGTNVYATWEDEIVKITGISTDTLTVTRAQYDTTAATHVTRTWIQEMGSGEGVKFMANIGREQFWITDSARTLRSNDDPVEGVYSTQYTVGADTEDIITSLMNHDEVVYVMMLDGLWYLSEGEYYRLIDELSFGPCVYHYKPYMWKKRIYIPAGRNSLYEYNAGTITNISPVQFAHTDTAYDDGITAICGDDHYLYVFMRNDKYIEVLAGRRETIAGSTEWGWHPIHQITAHTATAARISSQDGTKMLYIGTQSFDDGIIRCYVPNAYANPLLEPGYKVVSSGDFITPWYRTNFGTLTKLWREIQVTSKCIEGVTHIAIYYQLKGDDSWTYLGNCTEQSEFTGEYPAEHTDIFNIDLASNRVRFKFSLSTDDDDFSPVLDGDAGGYQIVAKLLPGKKKEIDFTLHLALRQLNLAGVTEQKTLEQQLADIEMLDNCKEALTLTGPDGIERSVTFQSITQQTPIIDEKQRPCEWHIDCKCVEV